MTDKLAGLLELLKPGQRVYIQGGPGECVALIDLLKANPGAARGVELWSCLVPGINTFDYGSLPDGPNVITFMASPSLAPSIVTGRTCIDAMPYSEIGAALARTEFDIAILHTSTPGADGLCRFGISSEAAALVWPQAKVRVGLLNERMPGIRGSDSISTAKLDHTFMIDAPLLQSAPRSGRSAAIDSIAGHAAGLIPNGAAIQSGIGEAPGAVIGALRDHRGLRVYSGLVSGEYRDLAESGALDPQAEHVTGIAWGDTDFYGWVERESGFFFRSALETHSVEKLSRIPDFCSVGSALEVDLEGNINLEWLDGKRVSSVGGAPDFMRGAAASRGGLSIIAMPATSRSGRSRIVPRLQHISIAADLADTIVTDHGIARLRGLSPQQCAEALIRIAAPEHRDGLQASRSG